MKKRNLIIILAIISFVLIGMIGIFVVNTLQNTPPTIEENEQEKGAAKDVIIRDKVSKLENSKKSINTIIPEFQNLDSDFQSNMNYKIDKDLNDVNVYKEMTESLESEEIGKFRYEMEYDRYNCGKYLSIVAKQYIHLGDGRPKMQKKCYVIDAERNASVLLEDVFANKYDYKTSIIGEINSQATKQGIELIGGNGLSELSKNQAFYIQDNKLVIYFEASEISATAVGELEFIMPYEMVDGKFVI